MISNPVVFSADEKQLIAELSAEGSGEIAWDSPDLSELRKKIKDHYVAEQGSFCCYCNHRLLSENGRIWDVEHIVARTTRPDFVLEPKNLAVSCIDCNIAKSTKKVMVNEKLKRYPLKSEKFIILHPHLDVYEKNIHTIGLIYLGKTPKGTQTIYTCNLLRFTQKYVDWEEDIGERRFENEVSALLAGKSAKFEFLECRSSQTVRS